MVKLIDYLAQHPAQKSATEPVDSGSQSAVILGWIGRGKKVLDLGCGEGEFSTFIKKNQNEVWGIEINPELAEQAEVRGVRVTRCDLEKGFPYQREWFDTVHLRDVLESLFDSRLVFDECARVLRPGGDLILTFRNLNSLSNRVRVFVGDYLSAHGAYPEDHHGTQWRIYNLRKIEELCERSGFEIQEVCGFWEGSGSAARLGNWVGRRRPDLATVIAVRAKRLPKA